MTERPATKLEDLPINPYIEWMLDQWLKVKERLWPKAPLKPRTFEQKLGDGYLSVTDNGLIFENKQGETMGFDLPNLRLVRLLDRDDFEVLYSTQGEMKKASFKMVPTAVRTGAEVTPEWQNGITQLRIITGAVVARFLSDRSLVQTEGIKRWTDQEVDVRLKQVLSLVDQFPSQQNLDDEERAGNVEWEYSLHMKMTNAIGEIEDKLLPELESACAQGSLSPEQRIRIVAMHAKMFQREYLLGHRPSAVNSPTGNPDWYKEEAEGWIKSELTLGDDLARYLD